jgi:hypothetical protein
MTKDEALAELQKWKAMYDQCEAVSKPLRELFGDLSDSIPLYKAVWCGFEFGTEQLNNRLFAVCFNDWLSFYAYDCDMGKSPQYVIKPNGEKKLIKTLEDLAWLIS